jgi:hypothetical protein
MRRKGRQIAQPNDVIEVEMREEDVDPTDPVDHLRRRKESTNAGPRVEKEKPILVAHSDTCRLAAPGRYPPRRPEELGLHDQSVGSIGNQPPGSVGGSARVKDCYA